MTRTVDPAPPQDGKMDIPQDKMALITLLAIDRVRIENALTFYQMEYEGLTAEEKVIVCNALSAYIDKIRLQLSETVNDLTQLDTPACPASN